MRPLRKDVHATEGEERHTMNAKEILLASSLLSVAADEFGNHGCNDWSFPADWAREDQIAFVREYHEWNGDPEEFRESHLHLPDYAVMAFLAHKLKKIAFDASR